jgi:hypothetical protein
MVSVLRIWGEEVKEKARGLCLLVAVTESRIIGEV